MLEHGPWVVRSRKPTRGRSLFLSIARIVCGNINTVLEWLRGGSRPPMHFKNFHVCVAVRIFSAFAKKRTFVAHQRMCRFLKIPTFTGIKPFFTGPLGRVRPSGGEQGTRYTRQCPFQLFTNVQAPSRYSSFILI